MIKTIIFDFGGVYFSSGTRLALEKYYAILDAPKMIIDEVFRCSPGKEGALLRKGILEWDEFWDLAIKKLGITKEKAEELIKIWHDSYYPNPGMEELVKELKKNYKLIVFSGNVKERIKIMMEKYNLKELFDDFVFSFDAGHNKCEKEFYEYLVNKLKESEIDPEECVFIDNDQEHLDEAAKFKIKGILFKDAEQTRQDLRKLDVKI